MIRLVSSLLAAAPVTFALLRAIGTSDLRFVWMALASFLAVTAVMTTGKARNRPPAGLLSVSILALAVATVLTAFTARLLGVADTGAIWAVGAAFAFCWTASYALDALSRIQAH